MSDQKLTETTLIPLGLAILAIGGGSFFIAGVQSRAEAGAKMAETNKADIQTIKEAQSQFQREVIERLARIETKLDKKGEK